MAQAGSSSSASGAGYASSVRAARLREVAVRALDETLTGCTPDDFVEGFPTLSATHGDALRHVCAEAQGQLRENATAEFDTIFDEMGVSQGLERLDSLIARQPALPDGSRIPLTSETEASDLIAMATLATKRQHRAALEAALREVQQENASLQEQYIAAQPALQAASAEIAACKALVEKTATSCERWRAANV